MVAFQVLERQAGTSQHPTEPVVGYPGDVESEPLPEWPYARVEFGLESVAPAGRGLDEGSADTLVSSASSHRHSTDFSTVEHECAQQPLAVVGVVRFAMVASRVTSDDCDENRLPSKCLGQRVDIGPESASIEDVQHRRSVWGCRLTDPNRLDPGHSFSRRSSMAASTSSTEGRSNVDRPA